MESLLRRCGFILHGGKKPNELTQDQALFQKQLSDHLQHNPNSAEKLVKELIRYVEEKEKLFFALYTTTTVESSNARCDLQDSLIHLLLGVPCIQYLITDAMFEKLAELSGFDENFSWQGTNYSLTFLIVKQFKCINNVVYSQDLCSKLLEILDVVTEETQKNIISCLPEILNDEYHSTAAKTLSGYLNKCSPLTVDILETLSSLNITSELLSDINDSAAMATMWMKCEYLPVVIRFLYTTTNEENLETITRTLRDNLAESAINKQIRYTETGQQSHLTIVLDQLKFFIQIRKPVADSWVKVIESNAVSTTQSVDLFFTFILFSVPNRPPTLTQLLRSKIQNSHFNNKLIRSTLKDFSWALKGYFDAIMRIADWGLKLTNEKVNQFGSSLYKYSFRAFDTAYKQEVIEHLLSHFASCRMSEVDSAIEILMDLTRKNSQLMPTFAIYIKRVVIDHFDQLSFRQLRLTYECLSLLACSGTQEGESTQHDLQMIIQKQITNRELKYKRFGIVGGLTFISKLAPPECNSENAQRALTLLELIVEAVTKQKLALALFYDELSYLKMKQKLHQNVEDWIYQNVITPFQDSFVVEIDKARMHEFVYGLDKDDSDGQISIDLMTLVVREMNDDKCTSPLLLSPQFRLLRIHEGATCNGSLENIDALLGCGVRLFSIDQLDEFQSLPMTEKDAICSVLFHCINWFREVVNGFATQTDCDSKSKVLTRVKNIVHLEGQLRKCLTYHTKYIPPLAHFDTEEKTADLKRKREATSTAKPRKKANLETTQNTQISQNSGILTGTGKSKKSTGKPKKAPKEKELPTICLSKYQSSFRQLDFDVFTLLNIKLQVEESDKFLNPLELNFLLEDLKHKLESSLKPVSKNPFLSGHQPQTFLSSMAPAEVFKQGIKLLPFLCIHLESAYEYFQELNGSQDMIDAGRSDVSQSVAQSFHLLLQCMVLLLSWQGIDTEELEETRNGGVITLSQRLSSSGGSSQLSFEDQASRALDYVLNFGRSLPTFACATRVITLSENLLRLTMSESHQKKIGKLAVDFMKQPWFDKHGNLERGVSHNENVQQVFTTALQMSSDPTKLLQEIVSTAFPELIESQEESKTYRTLNKQTFTTYYRIMFLSLIKEIKCISIKNDKGTAVLQWRMCVELFQVLVNSIKAFKNPSNLTLCMKSSRSFVESFLKLGIPLLETAFKRHKEDVLGLLRTFQLATRFLQHLCCHAKIGKQLASMKQIPPLKKNLEAFLYRVKAMLAFYNCQDAFWLGNLKNKDIEGEEIKFDTVEEPDSDTEKEAEDAPQVIPEALQDSDNSENEVDNSDIYSQSF